MRTGPKYFFPGMIALKLPIGLGILVLIGLGLFIARRLPANLNRGLAIILAASALFLFVLISGSTYGGIRHALPVVVLLSIFGGVAIHSAFALRSRPLQAAIAVALIAAAASAIPVMRPWEYFNEIIGASSGYKYFSDEGVDLAQRGKELAAYYHQVLEPAGEVPLVAYSSLEPEKKARGEDWLGKDPQRDQARLASPIFSGTVFVGASHLGKKPFWDPAVLRNTIPTARFGNLLVFRGACACGPLLAPAFYYRSLGKIYAEKPDLAAGEKLLQQSLALDSSAFFVDIELGDLELKRGARNQALEAFTAALKHAPNDPEMQHLIEDEIKLVSTRPIDKVPELRNPLLE